MRTVVTCDPAAPAVKAAQKMRDAHIGNVVIVEERRGAVVAWCRSGC